MRKSLYIVSLLGCLLSCKEQKEQVQPEQEATIITSMISLTGCNDGWYIETNQGPIHTWDISEVESFKEYSDPSRLPRKVWIRYELIKTNNKICKEERRVEIYSIRDKQ